MGKIDFSVNVLDKGYVRLKDYMGSDLTVVNAARVSFAKESSELCEKDKKLIKYLAEHGHTSPFRHAMLQFEIKAPLFVARQWWKYIVGSDHTMDAWNEVSRRYVEDDPEFYIPTTWRGVASDKKQGSAGELTDTKAKVLTNRLREHTEKSAGLYEAALDKGAAPEQARLFLSAYAMYTSWYWTASLQSVAHFLNQRLGHDAQAEITEYAKAVYSLVKPYFTESLHNLVKDDA